MSGREFQSSELEMTTATGLNYEQVHRRIHGLR